MRMARLKAAPEQAAVYHCISRVVGGQFLLDDLCKEQLAKLLVRLAGFCGLEIVTYCIMSNHFHVLLRVPARRDLSDEELLKRVEAFYGRQGSLSILVREGVEQRGRIDPDLRAGLLERMGDISAFMKEFKQRFSRWYNRHSGRFGTLWSERFKSVWVEDLPGALQTVAAYIDLNPVRAGLVQDPKDYRFCGYAAALAGQSLLRQGLASFGLGGGWASVAAAYRKCLFVTAGSTTDPAKTVLSRDEILVALERGGELSLPQVLRLRVRHFTDGLILGSKEFVNTVFERHRKRFGSRRTSGARPIRGAPLPTLRALRDLRVRAVG